MHGLKDRAVIVTGGANGIGAAIARRLAEEGCAVGILDMDAAAGEKVAGEIKAGGGRASFHAVDITDYDVGRARRRRCSSCASGRSPVWSTTPDGIAPQASSIPTPEFWRKVVDINLFGPAATCNHVVLPGMIERRYGRIVNVASDAGRVGSSGEAVYSAAKGGIIAFTKTMARELVGKGIILNTSVPGPTDTAILRSFLEGPGRRPHRRRAQARHPDAARGRAGGLPGARGLPAVGRRRLHHRADHQRLGRSDHARIAGLTSQSIVPTKTIIKTRTEMRGPALA